MRPYLPLLIQHHLFQEPMVHGHMDLRDLDLQEFVVDPTRKLFYGLYVIFPGSQVHYALLYDIARNVSTILHTTPLYDYLSSITLDNVTGAVYWVSTVALYKWSDPVLTIISLPVSSDFTRRSSSVLRLFSKPRLGEKSQNRT